MASVAKAHLPAVPEWADPNNKTTTGELVAKIIDPRLWSNFLGAVEEGRTVPEALKVSGLTRYAFNGAVRTDSKAREQYEEAKVASVWKSWDYETVEEIMVAIMTNEKSGFLNKILDDRGLDQSRFYYLMNRDENVRQMYEEARQIQAENMSDELQYIADFGLNDTYTDDKGRTRVDQDVVQRSRLRVDTMKWRMAKLHWKRFGDRVQQDQNIHMVVDHAERLEAARKRLDILNAGRASK